MKTIFEYIKPQFKKLFWGLSIKFIGTSMDLCIPWILAYMIDNIISKKNIKEIYLWGVLMIICSFIGVFANIYANRNACGSPPGPDPGVPAPGRRRRAWPSLRQWPPAAGLPPAPPCR